ncbi:hypothetical protein KKE54_07115 [bacterium]|nr:hypothetical protein [bacterium]
MMKRFIFLSLFASSLFAEQDHGISEFLVDKDITEISNESEFGKGNTYSLLFAKHRLTTDNQHLHIYYGAKMGLVSEEYTSKYAHAFPLNKIGTYYAAAVGMEYHLSSSKMLLAESSRCDNQFNDRIESKLQVTYSYSY